MREHLGRVNKCKLLQNSKEHRATSSKLWLSNTPRCWKSCAIELVEVPYRAQHIYVAFPCRISVLSWPSHFNVEYSFILNFHAEFFSMNIHAELLGGRSSWRCVKRWPF